MEMQPSDLSKSISGTPDYLNITTAGHVNESNITELETYLGVVPYPDHATISFIIGVIMLIVFSVLGTVGNAAVLVVFMVRHLLLIDLGVGVFAYIT